MDIWSDYLGERWSSLIRAEPYAFIPLLLFLGYRCE